MKKAILAICTAAVIFTCNMLIPMSVSAEERGCNCNHSMTTLIDSTWEEDYSHQYWIKDGHYGPIYGSCYVHNEGTCQYVKCLICGYVDYNHKYNVQVTSSTHSSCPLSGN
ncbi:MAG: hypothetical protein IKO03_09595 [Lachnospiraceae bacterium]|nr:hypothetical protein [Lachnospiraceae bacterium]MBR4606630.1 hypothetical protein [Lachnospiraceae bacterium]